MLILFYKHIYLKGIFLSNLACQQIKVVWVENHTGQKLKTIVYLFLLDEVVYPESC